MVENDSSTTYEAAKALESTWGQPDKIHWSEEYAFRDSPYRLLHHQKGLIGQVRVQLLEAKDLERSYWSALAIGPVKHLGLSKAHGAVSAYCSIGLGVRPATTTNPSNDNDDDDDKVRAKTEMQVESPVVSDQNSPVWSNCEWDLPLYKGIQDGSRIHVALECSEDATAAESFGLPLVPSPQDRLLGRGELDITSLCLGETDGVTHVGVMDVWIPIHKDNNNNHDNDNKVSTGQVRLLISYKPNGLDPQENDLVALEAFGRRPHRFSSCLAVLPPLQPMRVLQRRPSFCLVEYTMRNGQKATMKLHRNSLFVVERTNLVDGAVNFVLVPADFALSTPVGRRAQQWAGPLLEATGELLMPAVLSARILWGAFRTTGLAALTGVQAATQHVWNESRDNHQHRQQQQSFSMRPPQQPSNPSILQQVRV